MGRVIRSGLAGVVEEESAEGEGDPVGVSFNLAFSWRFLRNKKIMRLRKRRARQPRRGRTMARAR